MIGTIGQLDNRNGGVVVPTIIDSTHMTFTLPAGCKVLCMASILENEADLISAGTLIKNSYGYDILADTNITVIRTNLSPLTILHGREILYVEGIPDGENNTLFYLPKGSRVNHVLTPHTGEISIPSNTKFFIEY